MKRPSPAETSPVCQRTSKRSTLRVTTMPLQRPRRRPMLATIISGVPAALSMHLCISSLLEQMWLLAQRQVLCLGLSCMMKRDPCYERRIEDERFILRSQSCRDLSGQRSPLHDPSTGEILRLYDHYRELRTHTPWRVPELSGYTPPRCHDVNAPEQSGRYALFAMLIFRPWRNTRAALSLWSGLTTCRGISTDEIWAALAAEYISWRDRLQSEYAAACEGGEVPQYNTADWWRLLTYEKLRNFELTSLLKTYVERAGPLDASGKPI